MKRKLATLIIGLMVASGSAMTACSSSDPIPDDETTETPQYESAQDDSEQAQNSQNGDQQFYQGDDPAGPNAELSPSSVPEATGPVATINGTDIPAEEFNNQIELIQSQNPQIPPEMLSQATGDIVDGLVQQYLVEDAIAASDIEISEELTDERMAEVREEFQAFLGPDMDFDDYLSSQGLSPEEFREEIRNMVALEQLIADSGVEMPTDEDARAFYDDNREMFTQPESVEARQILVAAESATQQGFDAARQRAEELHAQLSEEGADFEALATEHSDAPTAQQGGNMGRVSRFEVPPEFEEAAFSLEDGEISEPIRNSEGYQIIQVVAHHPEETQSFEDVRNQLASQLRNEALQEAIPDFLANLREQADVEIHHDNIQ